MLFKGCGHNNLYIRYDIIHKFYKYMNLKNSMKKLSILFILLVVFSSIAYADLNYAKQKWIDDVVYHEKTKIEWQAAQKLVAESNTPENVQNVIDKAKISLNAGLDAAIAFFEFQKEKLTGVDISENLKDIIRNDLDENIGVAESLKTDVGNIKTRLEVGLVTLKIVDKYLDLLVDVMRDSGLVFVEKADNRYDKLNNFRDKVESKIPEGKEDDYKDLLDKVESNMNEAKSNIDGAEAKYKSIIQKQGSRIAFQEGNNLIRQSNQNMKLAFENLRLIVIKLRGSQ